MKTIEETRRELFEAWYTKRYGKPDTSSMWAMAAMWDSFESFNAALDAVVIELPQMIGLNESFQGTPISEIRAQNHYNEAVAKCRSAITSTNLGLTVK